MNEAFGLIGTTVLVTGGTRGIGREISLRLARAGASVVATYVRNEDAAASLRDAAATEGLAIETLRADLSLSKGLAATLQRIADCGSDVVSLIHCAATGVHRRVDELTLRQWDWTMALNVRAFFELVQGMLPRLTDGSTVVALSSAGAVRAVPAYAAIGTSKGALESLARHFAVELAPRGIRVNILSPGSVATEAWDAFPDKNERLADATRRSPTGRLITVEEIAYAAQFLCSAASRGIVGHTLVIDGGTRVVD